MLALWREALRDGEDPLSGLMQHTAFLKAEARHKPPAEPKSG